MLQQKLKKIEDGVGFIGRRTKQARSQGKKIHITVEQEISRWVFFYFPFLFFLLVSIQFINWPCLLMYYFESPSILGY